LPPRQLCTPLHQGRSMFWELNEIALLLGLLAGYLLVLELSFRLGRARAARGDAGAREHIGSLQGSMLGLLALLLGFTFAMAVSRFDTRKALVLEEANAIGTTLLRASLLPEPAQQEVPLQLAAYVDARLAFYAAGVDPARLAAANASAARLERQLWSLGSAAAQADVRSVPVGLFIQSLNEVIDVREKCRVALDNHVPEAVIHLLLVSSCVALALVAYGCGLSRRRRFVSNATFALLLALVLTTILDIDRPRRGLIQVSQDSLVRLKASLPPLP